MCDAVLITLLGLQHLKSCLVTKMNAPESELQEKLNHFVNKDDVDGSINSVVEFRMHSMDKGSIIHLSLFFKARNTKLVHL